MWYFIGWVVTVITLLYSMGLVAMYGIQFSNMKTYQFITSMVINFFYTIIIEEPIKVCKQLDYAFPIFLFRFSGLLSSSLTAENQPGTKTT